MVVCPRCGGSMSYRSSLCRSCSFDAMASPRRVASPDEGLLVAQWAGFAVSIAQSFYIPGGDFDDLRQEALIGLMMAARTFDPSKGRNFQAFAAMAVKRHMMSIVTAANREKHQALNEARMVAYDAEDGPVALIDLLADPFPDAHESLETKELFGRLAAVPLTEVERRALGMLLDGVEYSHEKRLDNALLRARRKLRAAA